MTNTNDRRRRRFWGAPLAFLASSLLLSACAEIEVGAEVAKRVARADLGSLGTTEVAREDSVETNRAGDVQLAQASTGDGQSLTISPFLQPAPSIFEVTGLAVWDGKRTLQGVWVAHPLATSARRVRIFNQSNGQAVDGALFKRDTADNGASILISSEAAQLLGMGVGTPAELRIVAVSPVQRASDSTEDDQRSTGQSAAVNDASENAPSAATQDEASTSETQIAVTPAIKPQPSAQQTQPAEPKPETTIARTEPRQTTTAAATASTSSLRLPFVQAGVFGVPENASRLIRRIEAKDLPAEGRTLRSKGRKLTRVLVGPFQTVAQRDSALRTIRGMGLRDATPVRR